MAKKRIYYAEFRRRLESEPLQPVYLFTGAEVFLKEEGIRAIVDKAVDPAERSMNLECVYAGSDVSGQEAKERALTMPFFTGRRVVVVRQAEAWRAADVKAMIEYAQAPSPTTVLVLNSQEERLKAEPWKTLAACVFHVECYPLFDNQVPGWIESRARELGKHIARPAVIRLMERSGQNLAELDNELVKLVHYIGAQEGITEEDVEAATDFTRQDSVHEFLTALGRRQAPQAVQLAERILGEGMPPLQLLGAMAWHFRSLRDAGRQCQEGQSADTVLASIRNPQAKRDMMAQLQSYTQLEFELVFMELVQLDEHVKSGRGHWGLALHLAILRICQGATAAAGR